MTQTEAKYLTLQQVADQLCEEMGFNAMQVRYAIQRGKLRAVATEYVIEPSAVEDFKREFTRLNGQGKHIIRRPKSGKVGRK